MGIRHNLAVLTVLFCAGLIMIATPARTQAISSAVVVEHLRRANAGNAQEQFIMGLMFLQGRGMPQDFQEAAKWFAKAAEQGNDSAQISLGNLYDNGQGVPQDYTKAVKWYRRAAAKGNAQAMFFLGSMIYNGDGVKADTPIALAWFERALRRGYGPAQQAIDIINNDPASAARPQQIAAQKPVTPAPKPVLASAFTAPPPARPQPTAQGDENKTDALPLGRFAIQIGSFFTPKQARDHWRTVQGTLPPGAGQKGPKIFKKQLKTGKTVYRLNSDVFAKGADARQRCADLKGAGVDCIVVRY